MTGNLLTKRLQNFDENYKWIREKIEVAAQNSGRGVQEITLMAATKTVPVTVINHAIRAGIKCLGENRVQEFMEKYEELERELCDLQFIGQMQTNKVKYIIDKVSCIQSVDSVKLAREIGRQAEKHGLQMKILIEVNIGHEDSKAGFLPEQLLENIDEIRRIEGVVVDGLMSIPPICEEKKEIAGYFSKMHQYFVDITAKRLDNVHMNCLSMGMSDDFPLAIENGANLVRIGSSLFGRRV